MVGVEGLKKIVLLGAEGVNVGEDLLNKGGLLSLIAVVDEVQGLGTLEKGQLLAEAKDLSKEERAELNNVFKVKLVLDNKALEAKIESGVDVVDEAIEIGLEFLAAVKHALAAIEKVKKIVSP